MPKRKRDDSVQASYNLSDTSEEALKTRRPLVKQKIDHGKKTLVRALKLAKGFERQKLGRRHKAAAQKNEDKELARLDAEIEALKTLDLPNLAESHIYKTLLKNKAIAESPALPQSIKTPSKPATDPATANVTARLYNANPVKEAMAAHLQDLRAVMGIEGMKDVAKKAKTERAGGAKAPALRRTSEDEEDGSVSELDSGAEAMVRAKQASRRLSDALGEPKGSGSESEGYEEYDARVATSSEEESDEEITDQAETMNEDAKPPTKGHVEYRPSSLSPPPEDESDDNPIEPASASPKPAAKKFKAKPAAPAPRTSTFLPSLTMGGYWSGSGSEPEDVTDEVAP
ncbi:hypothetical protein LTS18_001138, partial [Coniosporium uncinatum]